MQKLENFALNPEEEENKDEQEQQQITLVKIPEVAGDLQEA